MAVETRGLVLSDWVGIRVFCFGLLLDLLPFVVGQVANLLSIYLVAADIFEVNLLIWVCVLELGFAV